MSALDRWEPIAVEYDPLKAGSIDGTDSVPHDRAIIRAMEAVYKPNLLVVGEPKCTVFVGRLNPKTTEDTIQKLFSKFGKIKRLRLVRDVVTGYSKGYAFVEYYDKYDARKAQRELHKCIVEDREILVDAECERTLPGWIPRRLGGGLSGKKESGQLRFGGKVRPFKKPIVPLKNLDRRDQRDDKSYRGDQDKYHSRDKYYDDYRDRDRGRYKEERQKYDDKYSGR